MTWRDWFRTPDTNPEPLTRERLEATMVSHLYPREMRTTALDIRLLPETKEKDDDVPEVR